LQNYLLKRIIKIVPNYFEITLQKELKTKALAQEEQAL